MLFGNPGSRYFSSLSPDQWTRIARSDQSSLSDGGYSGGDYGTSAQGGFEPSSANFQDSQPDYSQYGNFNHESQEGNHFSQIGQDDGHDFHGDNNHVHSVPISEHVEVTKPISVPVYKEIGKVIQIVLVFLN